MNIRISAGILKGSRMTFDKSSELRPTMESVRLAIFSMLDSRIQSINEESTFIDLYSGTGIMGLEALSRGAKKAIFVERNRTLCRKISENLDKLNMTNRSQVICKSVMSILNNTQINGSHIFIDPPYNSKEYNKILEQIEFKQILNNNGVIIFEMRNKSFDFIYNDRLYDYYERSKGDTKIIFLKKNGE